MKLPPGFDVGVATHTGNVRATNEDDYLVLAPPAAPGTLLVAIADGMGGVVGGGEASRAALRGLGAALLGPEAADAGAAAQRMGDAFAAASARVRALAAEVPALREMGTTLTAVLLDGAAATLGHVGDTRALRWHQGRLEQLTTDHAMREPSNYLLRCIGGDQADETPDIGPLEVRPGDRLVLLSDGIWGTVAAKAIAAVVGSEPAQAAADRLVALANAAGGPDNATAVVVHVGATGDAREVQLPRQEGPRATGLLRAGRPLAPPRWPVVVLVAAALVLAAALLRWAGIVDLVALVRTVTG